MLAGAVEGSIFINTSPFLTLSPALTLTSPTVPDVFQLRVALCRACTFPLEFNRISHGNQTHQAATHYWILGTGGVEIASQTLAACQ